LSEPEVVEGTVVRVTFESEATGFRVIKLRPSSSARGNPLFGARPNTDDLLTVVGCFPPVAVGENVRAVGKRESDPRHGAQLRAEIVTAVSPTDAEGIERYLGSGMIKGIGKKLAHRIRAHFGAETLRVLDHTPERLAEVPTLGARRASRLADAWREERGARAVFVELATAGIAGALAQRIHRRYQDRTLEIVRTTPYRLAIEVPGVGFRTADLVASRVGVARDDPMRAQAGVLHAIASFADDGHTVTPRDLLEDRAGRLLVAETDAEATRAVIDQGTRERVHAAVDALVGAELVVVAPEGLGHAPLVAHEARVGALLAGLLHPEPETRALEHVDAIHAEVEQKLGLVLAPAQRAAVALVAEAKVAVVTGGPGVGKTTVVRAILRLFERAKLRVALAAPTGRAAKRMQEATGHEATTIHRLLEFGPKGFARDTTNPLDLGALVVDESSMVDVPLMHALLRALPPKIRLVLVGDQDQLPSVGPGAVLRDAIASGVIPTARLTEVFRQAGASRIVQGAHAILRGEIPTASPTMKPGDRPQGELFLIERDEPEEAARTIVEVVETRLPRAFGLEAKKQIQVLVPMVKGAVGTRALNQELQARLNPSGTELRHGHTVFRVGDRVMQTKNDHEREVYNGDIGHVASVDDDDALTVQLEDGRTVECEGEELDALTLAYACTIHKSQGSEYPAVVLGLVNQHFVMLARKLLYTAVTRAKQVVVVVGSRYALREAVRDARGEERRTTLARLLRQAR